MELTCCVISSTSPADAARVTDCKQWLPYAGSRFSSFYQAWGAAILLQGGARATVHGTVFSNNRADERSVAGLKSIVATW